MFDSVAQLVEHNTFNVRVLGSNPSGITVNKMPIYLDRHFLLNQTMWGVKFIPNQKE